MESPENQNTPKAFLHFTKRQMLGMLLLVVLGGSSLGAWQSFFSLMASLDTAPLWQPILWFTFLAILFLFGTIIWEQPLDRFIGSLLIFLPGLLFVHAWEYGVAGALAIIFFYSSAVFVSQEGRDRLRFHFYRSIRSGSFLFIVGLSLLLSSAYYTSLRAATWEELVPRFRIGEGMTKMIFKIAGTVNPSFAELAEGNSTVDEFLLSLANNQKNPEDPSPLIAQEVFLENGRKQIAELASRPVNGDEKISVVLSDAVQNKLIASFSGSETERVPSPVLPFFLSLLLFLTLLSFASIIIPAWILLAYGLFSFFLNLGWLTLDRVAAEQEKLAV